MGTTENEPKEPTLVDIQAMAEKASKEAAEAKSLAEAGQKVESSLEATAAERNIELSDEDRKGIAEAVIAGFEARGVFEDRPEENPTPPPPSTDGGSEAGGSTPVDSPGSEPVPSDGPPRKRSFAERFTGR